MSQVRKLIGFPSGLIDRIEKYREDNYIQHFTQAVVNLILKGLESEGK